MIGDLDFELACVLYNIGALHAELGAVDLRYTAESMKVACTHFQCAVWAFQHLRDDNRLYKSKDMSHDMLSFFVQVMLSQAQECILEKSMLDNRKPSIVAKVAAQVVEYYSSSLLMLLQSAVNTNSSHTIVDIVGSKLYKEWKKFIELKVAYYNSICALYMGDLAQEQQKMGERVAWFESAEVKLNEAIKLAKGLDRQDVFDALSFVTDVISGKLGNAKKENDFVYHEKVPPIDKLTEVKGVSLVKGIPFSVCDPEISGPDIFARLVPIEAHETASIYSAKKDEIMRNMRIKIEDKNQELAAFMSSLQLDRDTLLSSKNEGIPDELIEVCAAMSVNPKSVDEVNDILNELEEISDEVDKAIKDTKHMFEEEERKEKEHQQIYGKRPPSMIVVELSKELSKHEETHKKAMLSNSSLRENLERHLDDVKLLISSSAQDVASLLPSTAANVPFNESNLAEMEKLLEKVEEMKSQRHMLENQLKETMAADDVMKQVLAHNKKEIEEVFATEIKKYDRITTLIEQNLSAQDNILRALTKANAKYSETRRAIMENERNRSARIASLIHTYEVFKELQSNSKRGFDFYQKFQNIVIRLQARTRGVCRVQDEERAQISVAQKKKNTKYFPENNFSANGETSAAPKLKDYLSYMNASKANSEPMSGPIPAANLLSNNSINILPPAQNYPPSSFGQISYNRPELSNQRPNQIESQTEQQPLTNGQHKQQPDTAIYAQPSPTPPQYSQPVQQYNYPVVSSNQSFEPQYSQPIQQFNQPMAPNNHAFEPQYSQPVQQYNQSVVPNSQPVQQYNQTVVPNNQNFEPQYSQPVQQYNYPVVPNSQAFEPRYSQPVQQYTQSVVPNNQNFGPQYSQPVQQYNQSVVPNSQPYEPQYSQPLQQYNHSVIPNNQTFEPQYPQPIQQYNQSVAPNNQPFEPQYSQPVQQYNQSVVPNQQSVVQNNQSVVPNNQAIEPQYPPKPKPKSSEPSDLLKQFDPLYDLNNGF